MLHLDTLSRFETVLDPFSVPETTLVTEAVSLRCYYQSWYRFSLLD
jgi:hypothetical protein